MAKRGVITLQALVKLIPHFLIFVALISIFYTLYASFYAQEPSAAQQDRDRVIAELQELEPSESFAVFTTGADYKMVLYGSKAEGREKACGDSPCVCIYEDEETRCEILKNIKSASACTVTACEREKPCVEETTQATVDIAGWKKDEPRQNVFVCRGCTKMWIASTADACRRQAG